MNLQKKSDINEIISSGEDVMLGSFHESVFKAMIRGYGEKSWKFEEIFIKLKDMLKSKYNFSIYNRAMLGFVFFPRKVYS